MKTKQVVSPKAISDGQLEKAELLHILGGFLPDEELRIGRAKCNDGCRKACKESCKSTEK